MRGRPRRPIVRTPEEFGREYVKWLIRVVNGRLHTILLRYLHEIPFVSVLEFDEHRESDGRHLRDVFAETIADRIKYRYDIVDMEFPASFLEVLVSLAYLMDDCILYDSEFIVDGKPFGEVVKSDDHPAMWFWEMMANIDLAGFTNQVFKDARERGEELNLRRIVRQKVDRVMYRRYRGDGRGGLFPLKHPKTDQRQVELWYQLNAYIEDSGRGVH